MNIIKLESKVNVSEVQERDGFYFVNGFLIEENQKIKFVYRTKEPTEVETFKNLSEDEMYKVTGDLFIKYKKRIYTAVNVASVQNMNGSALVGSP